MNPILDKEKYFRLAEEEGLSTAITELHHEMAEIELECFEGPEGYRPDLYQALTAFRDFSRELWKTNVDEAFKVSYTNFHK